MKQFRVTKKVYCERCGFVTQRTKTFAGNATVIQVKAWEATVSAIPCRLCAKIERQWNAAQPSTN